MRQTFINGAQLQENPIDTKKNGYFEAHNWNNTLVTADFGCIIYNCWNAINFNIQIRQFLIKSRKPVSIEIFDDDNPGVAFFLSVFNPLVTEWEGFPRRVMKEGNYGLLHMRPERFRTRLRKGVYVLYKVSLPDYYFDYLIGEHCKLANFYAKVRENRPAVIYTAEEIKASWKLYFSLKEFIESPLKEQERAFVLTQFLEGCIDLLTPGLIRGISRPMTVPDRLSRIEKVAKMINADPSKNPNIKELIFQTRTSKTNLTKGFHELYGVSPIEYVTQVRMKKALGLILNTDEPVKNIAREMGFRRDTAFVRAFKNSLHVFPGELRSKENVQSGN